MERIVRGLSFLRTVSAFWPILTLCLATGCEATEGDETPTPEVTPTATPTPTPTPPPTPQPTPVPSRVSLQIRFTLDPFDVGYTEVPPQGMFYGAIFNSADVTSGGPKPDVESIAGIEVYVDLTNEEATSPVLLTIEDFPVGEITVLGYHDINGNGADAGYPDDQDLVTLPVDNGFELEAGAANEIMVLLIDL